MSDAEALALLTPRQREVMQLARRGHDPEEISRRLSCTRQTVYVAMSAARKRIKNNGAPLYTRRAPRRDLKGDELTVCQFGHPKRPGRACTDCMRASREKYIQDEAEARVARELAAGKRCSHPMRSGRPCGLLLPCVHP